jgi:hypothetical protein
VIPQQGGKLGIVSLDVKSLVIQRIIAKRGHELIGPVGCQLIDLIIGRKGLQGLTYQ